LDVVALLSIRRLLFSLLGIAAVMVVLGGPQFGGDRSLATWRARVVSVDGTRVCTVVDVGSQGQDWHEPFCQRDGLFDWGGQRAAVNVGQCVDLSSPHPTVRVEGLSRA